jgi:hypothetical protein
MLPNFIVIGAPKCGTTTLCDLLGQHPQIFMCTPKEPAFFSRDDVYNKGIAWYESLFENGRGKDMLGEGSTGYTSSLSDKIASSRIAQHLPHARLIYCVRHPVRRIESIWMDYASVGAFGSREEGKLNLSRHFSFSVRSNWAFVDTSCYWARLNVYREKFPDHQIHIIFLEDLEAQPEKTLSACYRFLGCRPDIGPQTVERRQNVSAQKQAPTPIGTFLSQLPQRRPIRLIQRMLRCVSPSILEKPAIRPSWDKELLQEVIEYIRDDSITFLTHCGKPNDFWNLDI